MVTLKFIRILFSLSLSLWAFQSYLTLPLTKPLILKKKKKTPTTSTCVVRSGHPLYFVPTTPTTTLPDGDRDLRKTINVDRQNIILRLIVHILYA